MENNIDKEFFKIYYETHSTNSTKKYFHLTEKPFNLLLEDCNLSKHDKQTNIKLTNLEKYGCENVFQNSSVKEKSANTKLTLYGSSTYNNAESREQTCINRYGSKSASGNKVIQEKIKKTNLDRYGIDNPFRDKEKIKQSYINKYGSIEKFNEICEINRRENLLQKYGVSNSSQIPGTRSEANYKRVATCMEKYGVESATLLPQCTLYGKTSESKPNKYFSSLLVENNIEFIPEFTLKKYSYDFKIGNTLIEVNPTATHNSTWSPYGERYIKHRLYHYEKAKLARENGYRCICIWDWDDVSKILSLLCGRNSIYARNCIIKNVDKKEAEVFINTYHLQGYAKDSVRIGLYYNDELVSIMTFDKPRYNKNYEYELVRYCSSKNVIGGAEKLFKYFIGSYLPKSIISYCDLSKFDGNTYVKLGFTLLKEPNPSKHWYNIKTKQHITDNLLRQRGFDQLFGTNYGKGTSNEELMLENGFVEIYDCGQAAYIMNI